MSNELELIDDQQDRALPIVQVEQQSHGNIYDNMLMTAVQSGNIEIIERMMALKERVEANEARKAFSDAIATAKLSAPDLRKEQRTDFTSKSGSRTAYDFANIGDINPPILKWLADHGFSARWAPDQVSGMLGITCILTHRLGHSESFRLEAPPDNTGNKNGIQGLGSTQTYLERYTLLGVTGLAVAGMDDDGKSFSRGDVDTSLADEYIAKLKLATTDKDVINIWNAGAAKMEKHPRDFKEFQEAVAIRRGEINNPPQEKK